MLNSNKQSPIFNSLYVNANKRLLILRRNPKSYLTAFNNKYSMDNVYKDKSKN